MLQLENISICTCGACVAGVSSCTGESSCSCEASGSSDALASPACRGTTYPWDAELLQFVKEWTGNQDAPGIA